MWINKLVRLKLNILGKLSPQGMHYCLTKPELESLNYENTFQNLAYQVGVLVGKGKAN
jgi:hypothetical protein